MKSIELHARETAVPFYLNLKYLAIGNQFFEVDIPHFKMTKELDF
jgi:predicted GNAT family N-acyltransferase